MPILLVVQPIRLNPFVFYHNLPLPGPGDTWVQEDVQDRRVERWDRDLDIRRLRQWFPGSKMCSQGVKTKLHFIYSMIIPRGSLR